MISKLKPTPGSRLAVLLGHPGAHLLLALTVWTVLFGSLVYPSVGFLANEFRSLPCRIDSSESFPVAVCVTGCPQSCPTSFTAVQSSILTPCEPSFPSDDLNHTLPNFDPDWSFGCDGRTRSACNATGSLGLCLAKSSGQRKNCCPSCRPSASSNSICEVTCAAGYEHRLNMTISLPHEGLVQRSYVTKSSVYAGAVIKNDTFYAMQVGHHRYCYLHTKRPRYLILETEFTNPLDTVVIVILGVSSLATIFFLAKATIYLIEPCCVARSHSPRPWSPYSNTYPEDLSLALWFGLLLPYAILLPIKNFGIIAYTTRQLVSIGIGLSCALGFSPLGVRLLIGLASVLLRYWSNYPFHPSYRDKVFTLWDAWVIYNVTITGPVVISDLIKVIWESGRGDIDTIDRLRTWLPCMIVCVGIGAFIFRIVAELKRRTKVGRAYRNALPVGILPPVPRDIHDVINGT
ncbi:uncharacterized protein BJ171DRAFT_494127 [Polychytrium aggregatum]|uniref:uncharacterized protein n=1 Tax=Polychytrium aggregatum TaxID=110093 RepID=UPI0022FF20FE|nr:uncharacterized protein BJ171DRAFT_494127 [Polychytrium aggregatum]KAI9207278.1 hypothetical protein BJ171DRAFT_494127 [Polychytrium aggregatum]